MAIIMDEIKVFSLPPLIKAPLTFARESDLTLHSCSYADPVDELKGGITAEIADRKMASLADELDLDPAFDDANFDNHGSTSLSYDEGEQEGNSSVEISPIRSNGRRSGRRAARRAVRNSYSSEEQQEQQRYHTLEGLGEGFSLADELGNGNAQQATASSLADEVDEHDELLIDRTPSKTYIIDDETKARKDREYYLSSSEMLNSSLRNTETFLAKLKQTSAVSSAAVEKNKAMPSSVSNSSLYASVAPSDDTSTLEGYAGQIVKQIREHSNTREDQIRELQECDRLLRRALEEGGDWISALANVDDLENDSSIDGIEEDALAYISNRQQSSKYTATRQSISLVAQDDVLLEEDEAHRSADSSASFVRLPLSSLALNDQQGQGIVNQKIEWLDASRTTVCQEISSLQHLTMDLVTSLGSIHEQSQVAQASMNEAARRIKTIKTVFHNWNAEIQAAEQSQAHISSWEATGIESGVRPKDIREWTDNHMERFQRILNEASIKAAVLLSSVQDDVLDGIVARG